VFTGAFSSDVEVWYLVYAFDRCKLINRGVVEALKVNGFLYGRMYTVSETTSCRVCMVALRFVVDTIEQTRWQLLRNEKKG
jgi:hypothetical protein